MLHVVSHVSSLSTANKGVYATKNMWKLSSITVPVYLSFESIDLQIKDPTPTTLATIYQPPKPNNAFLQKSSALLTILWSMSPNVILLGDLSTLIASTMFLQRTLPHALTALDYSNISTHSWPNLLL